MNKVYPYSGAKVHFIFKVASKSFSLLFIFSSNFQLPRATLLSKKVSQPLDLQILKNARPFQ